MLYAFRMPRARTHGTCEFMRDEDQRWRGARSSISTAFAVKMDGRSLRHLYGVHAERSITRIDTVGVDACYGYARHAHCIAGGDGINERETLSCPPRPPITRHTQGI